MEYEKVVYPLAKVFLVGGWYTRKEIETLLYLMETHNDNLNKAIESTVSNDET